MNKNHNNNSIDKSVSYPYLAGGLEAQLHALAYNGQLEKLVKMDIDQRIAVINGWINEMYKQASEYVPYGQ